MERLYAIGVRGCNSNCPALPEWLAPWVVAGAVATFFAAVLWAIWAIRRRRN